jgi:DNA-binding NarL/FixJ family response regulator
VRTNGSMQSRSILRTDIAEIFTSAHQGVMIAENRHKSRVIVADDHAAYRTCLIQVLQMIEELDIVAHAEDGCQAVDLTMQLHPDLVLMDVNMPRMNGIEATRKITGALPDVRVIGLSMHSESAIVSEQMRAAGAIGYLTKDGPVEELLASIQHYLTIIPQR